MPSLAAYTAREGNHPQYVSIGVLGDKVTICVRGELHGNGSSGSFARMCLTREQFITLLSDAERALRDQ